MRLTKAIILSLSLITLFGCSVPEPAKYNDGIPLTLLYVESLNDGAFSNYDFNATYQRPRRSGATAKLELSLPLGFINDRNGITESIVEFYGTLNCKSASELSSQTATKKVTCRGQLEKQNNSFTGTDLILPVACFGENPGDCNELVFISATGNSRPGSQLSTQNGLAIHLVKQLNAANSQNAYMFRPQLTELSRQTRLTTLSLAIDAVRNLNP